MLQISTSVRTETEGVNNRVSIRKGRSSAGAMSDSVWKLTEGAAEVGQNYQVVNFPTYVLFPEKSIFFLSIT